jgi:hypothetical protein
MFLKFGPIVAALVKYAPLVLLWLLPDRGFIQGFCVSWMNTNTNSFCGQQFLCQKKKNPIFRCYKKNIPITLAASAPPLRAPHHPLLQKRDSLFVDEHFCPLTCHCELHCQRSVSDFGSSPLLIHRKFRDIFLKKKIREVFLD